LNFENIIKGIIEHPEYKKMKDELHHGQSRYNHSLRVAKFTYYITRKLGLDYISATRAALLHDFFMEDDFVTDQLSGYKKLKEHPSLAVENAKTCFTLNKTEEDAIVSHMFPFNLRLPKTVEGAVVNFTDKSVAIYELSRFKLSATVGVWLLFIFNFITFSNN